MISLACFTLLRYIKSCVYQCHYNQCQIMINLFDKMFWEDRFYTHYKTLIEIAMQNARIKLAEQILKTVFTD